MQTVYAAIKIFTVLFFIKKTTKQAGGWRIEPIKQYSGLIHIYRPLQPPKWFGGIFRPRGRCFYGVLCPTTSTAALAF